MYLLAPVSSILPLAVIWLTVSIEPVPMYKEPVNLWVSSIVSPKIVEPLLNDCVRCVTEEDTIYLCAITSPPAYISPPKRTRLDDKWPLQEPVIVVFTFCR